VDMAITLWNHPTGLLAHLDHANKYWATTFTALASAVIALCQKATQRW
jgi:hypothetical protein